MTLNLIVTGIVGGVNKQKSIMDRIAQALIGFNNRQDYSVVVKGPDC